MVASRSTMVTTSEERCTRAEKRASRSRSSAVPSSNLVSKPASRSDIRRTPENNAVTNWPIRTKKIPRLTQSLSAWGELVATSAGSSGPATNIEMTAVTRAPNGPKRRPARNTGM